ncbi:radical SAM protein [Streptomyces sp. NPDC057271]|uniref:radical SAM protein n=1 Tax=unclassified Streptomyces TaxID=2593676 RepID=UPI00362B40FB
MTGCSESCGATSDARPGTVFIPQGSLRVGPPEAAPLTRLLVEIPADPATSERGELENDVQLVDLGDGAYCLTHALRHRQIFGGEDLRGTVDALAADGAVDDSVFALMKAEGFVSGRGEDKNAVRASLAAQEAERVARDPDFSLLRVLLTDFCNLKCDYCKVVQNVEAPQKAPTGTARLTEVVEYFFANSRPDRPKIIHCTGGEPTLHWPELEHLLEERRRLARPDENCWVVVGTNATLITADRARTLARHGAKCIVSMDGPAEIHDLLRPNHADRGSWAQVDRGIRILREHGVEVSISAVFGSHNLPRADEIIEWFMAEYQPTGLGVNFMKPPTPEQQGYPYLIDGVDYAQTLYDIHRKWRDQGLFLELVHRKLEPFVKGHYRFHDCGAAAGANLNLDAKGKVGPCKSFLVMDRLALSELDGTAYSDSVLSRWRMRSPIYYTHCDGCSARGMCGNGCAYDAYVAHGDEMSIDRRSCEYTKRFNELMLRDLFELSGGSERVEREGAYAVTQQERDLVMGAVAAVPGTLSYSIGHHTHQ